MSFLTEQDPKMCYSFATPILHSKYWCDCILKGFYNMSKPAPYDVLREQIWKDMRLTKKQIDCPNHTNMKRAVDVIAETAVYLLLLMNLIKIEKEGPSSYYVNAGTGKPSKVNYYSITDFGKRIIESNKSINEEFILNLISTDIGKIQYKNLLFFWYMDKIPTLVLEYSKYKDFELDFNYSIIHGIGDADYIDGTLASALAEYTCFKDNESWNYFLAQLMQSKVLVPVHILPSFEKANTMAILHINSDELVDVQENIVRNETLDLIPATTANSNKEEFLMIFLSIRELNGYYNSDRKTDTLLYIEFKHVYNWLKKHKKYLDFIIFDLFDKYNYTLKMNSSEFIKTVKNFETIKKEYKGKDFIGDLRNVSLDKHISKKRIKKDML